MDARVRLDDRLPAPVALVLRRGDLAGVNVVRPRTRQRGVRARLDGVEVESAALCSSDLLLIARLLPDAVYSARNTGVLTVWNNVEIICTAFCCAG